MLIHTFIQPLVGEISHIEPRRLPHTHVGFNLKYFSSSCVLFIKRTHSDIVGVDVIWTRNFWIGFFDYNSRRVNCQHEVIQINPQQRHSFQRSQKFNIIWQAGGYQSAIFTLRSAVYVDSFLFVSFFPQEVGETGNVRSLRDSQGRIFLYLFLLLFSGFWPSFLGYNSLHSCCWRT